MLSILPLNHPFLETCNFDILLEILYGDQQTLALDRRSNAYLTVMIELS